MRKNLLRYASLVTLLLAAGTVWHVGRAKADDDSHGRRVHEFLHFGVRAAGTYVLDITQGDFQGTGLLNFHADGTFEVADTSDFGAGGGSLSPTTFGSWRSTGPRSLVAREAFFLLDPDSGELNGTVVLDIAATFDEDFQTGEATFTGRFVPAGQDPADPSAGFPVAPGTVSMRRLGLP